MKEWCTQFASKGDYQGGFRWNGIADQRWFTEHSYELGITARVPKPLSSPHLVANVWRPEGFTLGSLGAGS